MNSHDNLRSACKTLPLYFQMVTRFSAALGAEGRVFESRRPTNKIKGLSQKSPCCHDNIFPHGNAGGNILPISLPRDFPQLWPPRRRYP